MTMLQRTIRLGLALGITAVALGLVALAPAEAGRGGSSLTAETRALVDWNVITLQTTAAAPFDPPLEARNVALVQAAVYDAVDSIRGRYRPYVVHVQTEPDASVVAAIASASHRTLQALYPAQAGTLDAAYQASLAAVPDGEAETEGIDVGETAAGALLALRAGDHSADSVTYTPGSGAGAWVPTPPAFKPALDPGWGHVTPFFLRSGSQFRPGPPRTLTSAAYQRDFDEIRDVGSASSATRTAHQTDVARFWVATAPQVWNQAAQELTVARGLGVTPAARLFALLNGAGADAFIASWDAKFAYAEWRPVTAIRATADAAWTPLLVTPPFPDYPAGHTTYAGAAETVLTSVFGEHPGAFTLRSATAPGVELTYTSFTDAATEVVNARVWGGIHWRTSSEVGRTLGRQVGRYALAHALK
jgi:hypothetical protein